MIDKDVNKVIESLTKIGVFENIDDYFKDLNSNILDIKNIFENIEKKSLLSTDNISSDVKIATENIENKINLLEDTYINLENMFNMQIELFLVAFGVIVGMFLGYFIIRVIFDGN